MSCISINPIRCWILHNHPVLLVLFKSANSATPHWYLLNLFNKEVDRYQCGVALFAWPVDTSSSCWIFAWCIMAWASRLMNSYYSLKLSIIGLVTSCAKWFNWPVDLIWWWRPRSPWWPAPSSAPPLLPWGGRPVGPPACWSQTRSNTSGSVTPFQLGLQFKFQHLCWFNVFIVIAQKW